jgi:lysophospholipase L1-like esterase
MSSLVIYGSEFSGHVGNGLIPQFFKYRFLAEGDSWMDRSAMFHTSLLQKLAPKMDAAGDDVLIINLASAGDTMHRIGECDTVEFRQWLNTSFSWKFDAILLSAGGNDFIDAARDPDAGQGIIKDLAGAAAPANGRDCLNRNAVDALINDYLDPSFSALYNAIQSSRHADVPIFLNCYDTPTARNAPAFPGGRSWLFDSYTKNSIPSALWPDLTDGIFSEVQATVDRWVKVGDNLTGVPTSGTLIAAAAGSSGSNGDWLNEIHPNASGWDKLAQVWQRAIKKVLR